ncbi:MAG: hypothetical protein V1917_01950 [Candidatus Gottesmanbacteria bacterium]
MKSGFKPPMIGSFEDIGKDVVREVVKAPIDIAGKILESLTGTSSGKGQQHGSGKQQEGGVEMSKKPDGALGAMEETNDVKVKRAIARAALEQFASKGEKPPVSVWEEKQKKEQEKKEMVKKQAEQSAFAKMPKMSSKKRRGDLYGIKGKSSTEMSKNVRQD